MELNYSLGTIAQQVNGKLFGNPNGRIQQLLTDSRSLEHSAKMLFVAIKGKNHDGHRFIGELVQRGISHFLVSTLPAHLAPKCNYIVVSDTLTALQQLAQYHRQRFSLPVIGITGSNGKTVIKEWLQQLLPREINAVRSPKSYNSQIGVPLSVLHINEQHNLGIFEAGISLVQEMERLQPIIAPTLGIFSNVGEAHQENFASKTEKAIEKLKLFTHSQQLIYCTDYPEIRQALQQFPLPNTQLIGWSKKQINATITNNNTLISFHHNNTQHRFSIPFTDAGSIENALHCCLALYHSGFKTESIAFQQLQPLSMRLERLQAANNCTLVNDSYSNDLHSLRIALNSLTNVVQHPRKTLILSDLQQTEKQIGGLYQEVAQLIEQNQIDQLIAIGPQLASRPDSFPTNTRFYNSTESFLASLPNFSFKNQLILVKGARRFRFERIAQALQAKTHRTVLEIDLNKLQNNLDYFRGLVQPTTQVMIMVKAFSYGSGSYEIANWLQHQRVNYLGVAFPDEGVELRKAGIQLPIMVMNAHPDSFQQITAYQLEPELYSFSIWQQFSEYIQQQQLQNYPIHLKLDTGMHRLGFSASDMPQLLQLLQQNQHLHLQSVFSHLAGADTPQHDDFTHKQVQQFTQMCQQIQAQTHTPFLRHILNSAGIERHLHYQFNMVRVGIGLYGISQLNQHNTEVISSLKSYISQIKHIPQGESVGYNRNWIAPTDSRIATIPIGYADGLNRLLSNQKGSLIVHNTKCPIIGNICMDMCMIDITHLPTATEGNEVIIFGQHQSINELANTLQTIPYEILTSVSPRVKRVYYQ